MSETDKQENDVSANSLNTDVEEKRESFFSSLKKDSKEVISFLGAFGSWAGTFKSKIKKVFSAKMLNSYTSETFTNEHHILSERYEKEDKLMSNPQGTGLSPSWSDAFIQQTRLDLIKLKKILPVKSLPEIILAIGGFLIVLRFFYPPQYINFQGFRYPYRQGMDIEGAPIYPLTDFHTALLHGLGIAVVTGVIFYILKKKRDSASRQT